MKKLLMLLSLVSIPSFAAVGVFSNDFSQPEAVDIVSSLLYPYVKMVTGGDGVVTPVSSSNPLPVNSSPVGQNAITIVRNVYSSTNVTTSAWVQLVASLSANVNKISIFDSSGQTLKIGFGASGFEVAQIYVFPGGNGDVTLAIPEGTRISIEAVSATANAGEIDINALQ